MSNPDGLTLDLSQPLPSTRYSRLQLLWLAINPARNTRANAAALFGLAANVLALVAQLDSMPDPAAINLQLAALFSLCMGIVLIFPVIADAWSDTAPLGRKGYDVLLQTMKVYPDLKPMVERSNPDLVCLFDARHVSIFAKIINKPNWEAKFTRIVR